MVNGARTFFVGYVIGLKRASQPYKLGKKVVELSMQARLRLFISKPTSLTPQPTLSQVRTHNGVRLTGFDTLSNNPPPDGELDQLKQPLDPVSIWSNEGGGRHQFCIRLAPAFRTWGCLTQSVTEHRQVDVRKKIYKLQQAMRESSELFEDDELRRQARAAPTRCMFLPLRPPASLTRFAPPPSPSPRASRRRLRNG